MVDSKRYRDRIYIIKDIILTLSEYGELNQTTLLSFCGLNLTKHKKILDDLQKNELIEKNEISEGKRNITIFKPTKKGMDFCHEIIQPYEDLFPRNEKTKKTNKLDCLLVV